MVRKFLMLGACALGAVAAPVAQAASQIGTAAAVSNSVRGSMGGAASPLHTGDSVFQNQTVLTAAKSSAQLLFRDQTALTVGPISRIKLDRYVYDPSRRTGRIVVNVAKGAFRFVSGVAKSSSYRIQTPVASIAVRGTIFDTYHHLSTTIAVLVKGGIDVCARPAGNCVAVNVPGHYVIVNADGTVVGPRRWTGAPWNVNRGIPLPFFGRWNAHDFSDQGSSPTDLRDVIDNGRSVSPPAGGGGGGVIIY